MATPAEVRAKLESLSPDDFKKFQKAFGGEGYTPERYAREMAQKPEWEYRICQLLDLPTEQERTNRANSEALEAAKASARAAEKSAQNADAANAIAQSANQLAEDANKIAAQSAQATKEAAETARKAYRVAIISLIVSAAISVGSLIVAVIALVK